MTEKSGHDEKITCLILLVLNQPAVGLTVLSQPDLFPLHLLALKSVFILPHPWLKNYRR